MTKRTRPSWPVYALGLACAGAIVAAILVVGPTSESQGTVTRTATVAQGVVQSTVSGSGNLQAASQLNLGFKTSGTVTGIYVAQGEHVTQGQLIASLDPQSAEVTLEQAKASLQSAEANLAKEEETDGESSTGGDSGTGGASAAAYRGEAPSRIVDAAYSVPGGASTAAGTTPTDATTTPASATPTGTAPSATAPSGTTTQSATTPSSTAPSATTTPSAGKRTTTAPSSAAPSGDTTGERERKSKEAGSGSSTPKATISAATREANLASARAAVKSDQLTVKSDEQAVQDTKLYAPESGTIVSLAGQVGEVVSGSGTTRASSSASSSSGATGTGATGATGRSTTGASNSSTASGDSSSSSSFAVLSDLSSMQLVVPLSESEIGDVKAGQIATVTVEALSSTKLAAHVSEVALVSSSSSGAVSYDVTFQLDQLAPGIRLGMSATAEVVINQAEGINVPTSAITADTVTVERAGKQVRQRVVTGLAGNTSTIVLSGLKAGETVVLPAAAATSSSATNVLSRLAGRAGLGGAGGFAGAGGGGFAGAGGGAFFRGGG
ncbi:MAG TPA: biotin/lipoyl-binding protein [Solirubrobacteraceae bacterium]|jgi:multidrug efflux pump subunit AcrA (membrane-fusion protein)|nr:biotin/lipoyl-binding protein [Solirubrobacteraceae bacterium]